MKQFLEDNLPNVIIILACVFVVVVTLIAVQAALQGNACPAQYVQYAIC